MVEDTEQNQSRMLVVAKEKHIIIDYYIIEAIKIYYFCKTKKNALFTQFTKNEILYIIYIKESIFIVRIACNRFLPAGTRHRHQGQDNRRENKRAPTLRPAARCRHNVRHADKPRRSLLD